MKKIVTALMIVLLSNTALAANIYSAKSNDYISISETNSTYFFSLCKSDEGCSTFSKMNEEEISYLDLWIRGEITSAYFRSFYLFVGATLAGAAISAATSQSDSAGKISITASLTGLASGAGAVALAGMFEKFPPRYYKELSNALYLATRENQDSYLQTDSIEGTALYLEEMIEKILDYYSLST